MRRRVGTLIPHVTCTIGPRLGGGGAVQALALAELLGQRSPRCHCLVQRPCIRRPKRLCIRRALALWLHRQLDDRRQYVVPWRGRQQGEIRRRRFRYGAAWRRPPAPAAEGEADVDLLWVTP
jgi:hypothetical protein